MRSLLIAKNPHGRDVNWPEADFLLWSGNRGYADRLLSDFWSGPQ
jgi:hypothetical protein